MKKWAPIVGALTLALAACSAQPGADGSPARGASTRAPSSAGSPTASQSSAPSSEASPTAIEDAPSRVIASVPYRSMGFLAMSGTTVAYPYAEGRSDAWTAVGTSLGGASTRVARSEWGSRGRVGGVAIQGHWLTYVDKLMNQGAEHGALWRVWAVDLTGDSRVLLASNGQTSDDFAPQGVNTGGGYFFWSQVDMDTPSGSEPCGWFSRGCREYAWKPGWPEPRVLARTPGLQGDETFGRDGIVYLGPPSKGGNKAGGGECWHIGLDGGAPTALTHTSLAAGCAASDDTFVWTQRLPFSDPRRAGIGRVGDAPYTTWTLDLADPDTTPTKIYRGVQSGLFPVAGDGFVAWGTKGTNYLMRSTTTATTTATTTKVPGGWRDLTASGRHLATWDVVHRKIEITLYDAP